MIELITTALKELLNTSPQYYLKVQPASHLRVTKGDRWIFASTDEYLKDYDRRKGARTFNRKTQLVKSNEHKKEIVWVSKKDGFTWGDGCYVIAFLRHMPRSWKIGVRKPGKRDLMAWKPMLSRPDLDNYYKRVSDSLMKEDNLVWCAAILKLYVPDNIEEGTYFINVPSLFEGIVSYLKEKLISTTLH